MASVTKTYTLQHQSIESLRIQIDTNHTMTCVTSNKNLFFLYFINYVFFLYFIVLTKTFSF